MRYGRVKSRVAKSNITFSQCDCCDQSRECTLYKQSTLSSAVSRIIYRLKYLGARIRKYERDLAAASTEDPVIFLKHI